MTKLKVIELFAGVGATKAALDKLGIDVETVNIVEWEYHSTMSYHKVHVDDETNYSDKLTKEEIVIKLFDMGVSADGKKPLSCKQIANIKESDIRRIYNSFVATKNLGSIVNIGRLPYADFWTYSFPCQDISLAGKRKGMVHPDKKGNGFIDMLFAHETKSQETSRSGMLYEVQRLLYKAKENGTLPKFLLLENVEELVGKKNIEDYNSWLDDLNEIGYNSYWKVLDAKQYGVPQHRERVFTVSIHKSIDNKRFYFPLRFPLIKTTWDLLEKEVDEKYYLTDKQIQQINSWLSQRNPIKCAVKLDDQYMTTITAKSNTTMNASLMLVEEPVFIQRPHGDNKGGAITTNVMPTITTSQWQHNNYLLIPEKSKKGYAMAEIGDGVYLNRPHQKRGVVQKGLLPTITTQSKTIGVVVYDEDRGMIYRYVTPKEAWNHMGFTDEQFDRAASVCSNSQLYKQAGNSIVVDVLYYIFKQLFIESGIKW